MTFPAKVNEDFFYRAPDGRECFVVFDGDSHAHFGSDVTAEPGLHRTVGFTAEALRFIADVMERSKTPRS